MGGCHSDQGGSRFPPQGEGALWSLLAKDQLPHLLHFALWEIDAQKRMTGRSQRVSGLKQVDNPEAALRSPGQKTLVRMALLPLP